MSIIRIEKTGNYSVISNDFLNDPQLSFQQKGLLAYLLTKPDHWQINVKHLVTVSKDGRDTIYKMIEALIEIGYIQRDQKKGTGGKFITYDYKVFESKKPLPENPDTVKPDTEKPDNSNNLLLLNTNNSNTPKKSIEIKDRKIAFLKLIIDWEKENPEKYPKRMFIDFANYWTEKTTATKNHKMRFEEQRYFELHLRFATWFRKCNDQQITIYWEVEKKIDPLNILLRKLL